MCPRITLALPFARTGETCLGLLISVKLTPYSLQYLVAKGAILRKGQKIKTKFCKYSQTPHDRVFVATMYTSDVDKIMRYTDEWNSVGGRWTLVHCPRSKRTQTCPRGTDFIRILNLVWNWMALRSGGF
ncbi:hypothetical protein BGY98DRAFT_57225 [Russula aff. rugulosa BPL654]|nr:hypothetical protein BGY98DRAFT_57225 [Russula aff. rugulosa BPL654]